MDFGVVSSFVILAAFASLMTRLALSDKERSAAKAFIVVLAVASWGAFAFFAVLAIAGLAGQGGDG